MDLALNNLQKLICHKTHTNKATDEAFHTFTNGICPKMNVIARLEFELAMMS